MLMEKTLNKKINEEIMQPKLKQENDVRIAVLEISVGHINQTLTRIERTLEKIDERIEKMDIKFDRKFDSIELKFDKKFDVMELRFDKKFEIINNRLWNNFIWLLVTTGTFSLLLAGTMAKGFHWIGG
jgi:frataxin-like iron-binding protein CyaY